MTQVHYLNSLDALNTSNQRIRDIYQGKAKDEIPATGVFFWVDVRDVALAHVKAFEVDEAANKRFFVLSGYFSNKEVADIIRKNFPDQKDLPSEKTPGGEFPEDGFAKYDNSRSKEVLGLKYYSLEQTIVDTVKSLKNAGA